MKQLIQSYEIVISNWCISNLLLGKEKTNNNTPITKNKKLMMYKQEADEL